MTFPHDFRWVARRLREIADLSELLDEDARKAPSYRRASRSVEAVGPALHGLAEAGRLTEIPGVGPAIAEKIMAILATGTCPLLDRLRDRTPHDLLELLDLPGIGPGTVARLRRELGIEDEESLEEAARAQRLRALPRFGARREEAILAAIRSRRARAGRMLLGEVWPVARELCRLVRASGARDALEVGALRRREAEFAEASLAVACPAGEWPDVVERLRDALPEGFRLDEVREDESRGPEDAVGRAPAEGTEPAVRWAASVSWTGRVPRSIRIARVDPDWWGPALLVLTGPDPFVRDLLGPPGEWEGALRRAGEAAGRANPAAAGSAPRVEIGAAHLDAEGASPLDAEGASRLAADGAARDPDDPWGLAPVPAEAAFLASLGRGWVPPELRGRPDPWARVGELSRLVSLEGWQAELHAHTTYSDASGTVAEMAEAARARGYRTLAVTDHSAALAVARGLDAERLRRQAEEIASVRDAFPDMRILAGSEADILRDGRLDVPEGVALEWVVASVHSNFRMDRDAMTNRVVAALRTGRVDVLGHPTGRLLGRRDGYELDLAAVFEAAGESGTAIEINANPARLDLDGDLAAEAIAAGLPLAVNTDAHSVADLDLLIYGVWTARRAGARRDDVINTWDPDRLVEWARRHR